MRSLIKPLLVAAVSLGLLGGISGCADSPKPKVKMSQAKKVVKMSQAMKVKVSAMKEICAASNSVAKYIKGSKSKKKRRKLGTAGDMEMRAVQIATLAKRLKYGSAVFYAKGLEEAAKTGIKGEIADAYKPVKGAVAAAIKLDANKKVYGKCKCKKGKVKCKKKKKKKK